MYNKFKLIGCNDIKVFSLLYKPSKYKYSHKIEEIFKVIDCFKILATNKKKIDFKNFDHILSLPTSIKEINNLIDKSDIKRKFHKPV